MALGFGQVRAVLAGMHRGVPPDTVEARLKYLQRLPFPRAFEDVGRGGRIDYGPEDLLRLVCAFELLAAGVTPQPAASFVDRNWTGLSAAFAQAWELADRPLASLVVLARVDGLEAGSGGGADCGPDEAVMLWRKRRDVDDRRATVLDLVATVRALRSALKDRATDFRIARARVDLERWLDAARLVVRTGT